MGALQTLEHVCLSLRHSRWLRNAEPLWSRLRQPYGTLLDALAPKGLERVLNGTDSISVVSQLRGVGGSYEPEVWKYLMDQVRSGDIVVDIGAHVGLYSIAMAKRVGRLGEVHSFEPNPANFALLEAQARVNDVRDRITLYAAAVADRDGVVAFSNSGSESRIAADAGSWSVPSVRLDSIFSERKIDVMKIDVEGFEEIVLRGGPVLFADDYRAPRLICIEVHPYAWRDLGLTSASLINLLARSGYAVQDLSGRSVHQIDGYGEIVAVRGGTGSSRCWTSATPTCAEVPR